MFVGQLIVNDNDLGNNGIFDFIVFIDNELNLLFLILKSGIIVFMKVLDWEIYLYGINFKVVVVDKGMLIFLSSIGYVIVFFLDENDNYLEIIFFNVENKIIVFLFDLFINSIIGKVEVRDWDYDNNVKMVYFFVVIIISFILID